MNRCPSCDYPLPRDRNRLGARCPNCREPLYESRSRPSRPARPGEGACALHPGQEAAGACGRCGNYYCTVCRTRWRDRILCPACVERALESHEAAPEHTRAHRRQAVLGLLIGVGGWATLILAALVIFLGNKTTNIGLLLLAFLMILGAVVLAVLGLGQAAAAIRSRGPHMIAATSGLLVSGLFLGVFIGIYIFRLWFQ